VTAQGGRQTKEATMTTSTHLIRITRLLVLCAVVAGTAASVAGAYDAGPMSYGERWRRVDQNYRSVGTSNIPTPSGLKADGLRLQAMAQVYKQQIQAVPDLVERYAAKQQIQAAPDVVERYAATHGGPTQSLVSRPPDISDTALAVQYGSVSPSKTGFDWGDWAIGLAAGFGLALVAAGGVLLASHRVARIGKTGATAAG
jgi:hypothetical protein